jgi:DNA-binding NarL/FixJ family response regulator
MTTSQTGSQRTYPSTGIATVLVSDDRPLVRAGLRAIISNDAVDLRGACALDQAVEVVERERPAVLVVAVRENDPDPFRVVATAKALHSGLRVVVIADTASVIDLREAVIAGVDSFLLTDASEADIRDAVRATARGERVVSPEVAMQLAGSWRHETRTAEGSSLTPRELEVLQLLAEGLTNQEIGQRLELSARTIKTHVQNLLSKLDVPDRTGAVARGFRLGIIR